MSGAGRGDDPNYPRTQLVARRDVGAELRAGHRIQEFVVEGLVGVGGYGIVYRVRDTRLDRVAALKEYFPASLAQRDARGTVAPRTPRHVETFQLGLKSFVNEARLLASFDHPSLVKVYRFWGENGTAYMLMPFYEGETLRRWLAALGAPPREEWLRGLAAELIDALEILHAQNCFHRDVAPDNILLLYDKRAGPFIAQAPRPLLLDFGAARRVIGEATHALTAILKSGYSPIEQYGGEDAMQQGAWSDVYALCAVLYAALAGRAPPGAIARAVKDQMVPAAQIGAGRYAPPLLAAIDAGLAVRPERRPQTMAELRRLIEAPVVDLAPPPRPAAAPARAQLVVRSVVAALAGAALAAMVLAALFAWWR